MRIFPLLGLAAIAGWPLFTFSDVAGDSHTFVSFSANYGLEFRTICSSTHRSCGLESTHCFDVENGTDENISLEKIPEIRQVEFMNMPLLKALDKAVGLHPGYEWTSAGGVINMRPQRIPSPDLLSRKIAKVSIHGEPSERAFWEVLKQAGIRVVNLRDFDTGDLVEKYAVVSLELTGVTVRDALNAIAAADGAVMWEFGPQKASASEACFVTHGWGTSKDRIQTHSF